MVDTGDGGLALCIGFAVDEVTYQVAQAIVGNSEALRTGKQPKAHSIVAYETPCNACADFCKCSQHMSLVSYQAKLVVVIADGLDKSGSL